MKQSEISIDLVHILINDVSVAHSRVLSTKRDSDKRDFVRAVFSGIEGLIWYLKVTITEGHGYGLIKPAEADALFERTWNITERGDVKEAPRFLPLPTSIKLLVKTVKRFDPKFEVDFQGGDWNKLIEAIEIRNRLVHPKSIVDLSISDEDVERCSSGFSWIVNLVLEGQNAKIAFLDRLADAAQISDDQKQFIKSIKYKVLGPNGSKYWPPKHRL